MSIPSGGNARIENDKAANEQMIRYINLKLAALGCPTVNTHDDADFQQIVGALLPHQQESDRLLFNYLCPADQRLQDFLTRYFGAKSQIHLPRQTFILDRAGMARTLSLPPDKDYFSSDIVSTYRIRQGILHNPKNDRRTTQGSFHVAEGGLPIPQDKQAVPKVVFGNLLKAAMTPPAPLMGLPFTAGQSEFAETFVSLLIRPIVVPEVPGYSEQKTMEIRFFVPGTLVSNLDFVETIFGNAGDPFLPENDAALDVAHWTGNSGCVILAPHLTRISKKELGLPHIDKATDRQKRDGMCWSKEDEPYNHGNPFKITCRDASGVIVTLIADNYFGYCKKEVKTQISFASNLFGGSEEEHSGGALVFPSYDLGEEFSGFLHLPKTAYKFSDVVVQYESLMTLDPRGFAVDKKYPDILYVPEDVHFDLHKQSVSWTRDGKSQSIKLLNGVTYIRPSGYKVHLEKPPGGRAWRLIGTVAEGTLCHKPCTVSGGGKSEISKPITDAVLQGPVFVADFKREFEFVSKLLKRDYSDRFKYRRTKDSRPILGPERSLGSVIKLLTPASREYTKEYNEWLITIPQYVKELVFIVKRFYKPEWGENWREHFSVDTINGAAGNELKCEGRKLVANYLRVGYESDGSWRTFGLRKDFQPAYKWAFEDDITASTVVPKERLKNLDSLYPNASVKFVLNCENRLFQRPDEAIHRGYDHQTESDFAQPGNFLSNYEPLTLAQAREMIEDSIAFDQFSEPMQKFIREFVKSGSPTYFVSSAHPRIVDGKPSKNPRYLQMRPDLVHQRDIYIAAMGTRMRRRVPAGEPVYTPVNAVLPGRRNNPPDIASGIRSLAVYNPIHYMELPEAFMEFICSMTGKSPSTTGAGSEGALTKGPFNALPPIIDLNATLVGYILTGYDVFVTAAGYIGPHQRVDHDISLLVPEIWCRMSVEERQPKFLIENGYLEACEDYTVGENKLEFSRLGYRITLKFVRSFFGRMFNHPHMVFTEKMLRPEGQDWEIFVDGVENILQTQKRAAQNYFDDGSIAMACPPLKALLHIMVNNNFEGKNLRDKSIRDLFTAENMLKSDWYLDRLKAKQMRDIALWKRHVDYASVFLNKKNYKQEARRLNIAVRLAFAQSSLDQVQAASYLESLKGTIGLQPALVS